MTFLIIALIVNLLFAFITCASIFTEGISTYKEVVAQMPEYPKLAPKKPKSVVIINGLIVVAESLIPILNAIMFFTYTFNRDELHDRLKKELLYKVGYYIFEGKIMPLSELKNL